MSNPMTLSRRRFLISTGSTAVGALFMRGPSGLAETLPSAELTWTCGETTFRFAQHGNRLLQQICLPSHAQQPKGAAALSYGPEVGLLCTGATSPDNGTKLSGGVPGKSALFPAFSRREASFLGGAAMIDLQEEMTELRFELVQIESWRSALVSDEPIEVAQEHLVESSEEALDSPSTTRPAWK